MTTTGDGIHRRNLKKLASYLGKLPDDYKHFYMGSFARVQPRHGLVTSEYVPSDVYRPWPGEIFNFLNKPACGTVACAAGHAPMAGINPKPGESWTEYVKRTLVDYDASPFANDVFTWLFDEKWADVDNTVQGAAERIRWFLHHESVPEDYEEQMLGSQAVRY